MHVVGFQDADLVDVKPFIFRTEFTSNHGPSKISEEYFRNSVDIHLPSHTLTIMFTKTNRRFIRKRCFCVLIALNAFFGRLRQPVVLLS